MKLEQIIEINYALNECSMTLNEMRVSKDTAYDSNVSFLIARNINLIKVHVKEFNEENNIRIESFSEKDENGETLIKENKIIFGKNKVKSDDAYKELIGREKGDVSFIAIKRNQCTDKFPPQSMSVLLDTIITE